jgi:hypothetical protein
MTRSWNSSFDRVALVVMWVVATGAVVMMLLDDARSTGEWAPVRHLLHAGYVGVLLLYLGRTGASAHQPLEIGAQKSSRQGFSAWVSAFGLGVVLILLLLSDSGVDILVLLMMVATVWILLAWRRDVRLRSVAQGLAIAAVALLAGLGLARNGFISDNAFYLLAGLSFPMYIAGGMLVKRTRLGGVQLLAGRYDEALKSVAKGSLLFVPLGLVNAAGGSPGLDITWVTEWWMPLSLPWFSGIAEETWFRLLLVGVCFLLLRPVFRGRPDLAGVAAILFSGITFGLAHGRTLETLLTTGLLYGVPLAAVFARRDWEHAVGAHYMINAIPWTVLFLET